MIKLLSHGSFTYIAKTVISTNEFEILKLDELRVVDKRMKFVCARDVRWWEAAPARPPGLFHTVVSIYYFGRSLQVLSFGKPK
jgi:hypothetical protein